MKNKLFFVGMTMLAFLMTGTVNAVAQTRDRSRVPVEDTWNLKNLYSSDEAWRAEKDRVAKSMDNLQQFKGKLAESSETLFKCLDMVSSLRKAMERLDAYASMASDLDLHNAHYIGLDQEVNQLETSFNSKTSFIDPELIKLSPSDIDRFIREQPKLEVYRFYLDDLQRRKKHTLSDKEEKIIAETGMMATGPEDIYSIFTNAELPYPKVLLPDGKTVKLNQAGYVRYRASTDRADRETVFREFWGTMNSYRETLGATLYAKIKSDVFYARVRNYDSSLQAALDVNNIPVAVYHSLIDNVDKNLGTFHRYLKLKKRMLGVDTLKYSDIYAPAVKGVDLKYTFDEAKALVLKAIKPLGKDYSDVVKQAFANRWIDVYPTEGKRSGGYSNGSAYDVHPYILLNFNGQYDDVSTLAHELGHTMQSYLSNKNQPYPLADYPIFVAEVASTLNEALLFHEMMNEIKDDDVRLSLLMEYLDGIKGTVFRQAQFAEFELKIHEMVEKDIPLTGDVLSKVYGDILKKYYGCDEGITQIDDRDDVEWAFIPHFYYDYYVYQYATSFTASTALAEKVLDKDEGAVDKVLTFLSSGGSKYPIDLLKQAGVDMTTSAPFDNTMAVMNRTMDEIEKILDKKGM